MSQTQQTLFPRPPSETMPTMYDLPSESPEDMGLPDEFHDFQPQFLRETCKPSTYSAADFFVGTDINLYYDGRHPQWYKRPDWFLALGVSISDRQQDMRWSYVVWQECVNPFLIVELLSPGTEDEDLGRNIRELGKPPIKWEVYERLLRVPFYVVFDRYENDFRIFSLIDGKYEERKLDPQKPQFWFEELQLGLGLWEGFYQGFEGKWLRWYDAQGIPIPTNAERAHAEMQRADEATRQADEATRQADEAIRQADEAIRRADEAVRQVEVERSARLEAEAQILASRQASIAQLLGFGLTAEQIAQSLGLSIAEVQAITEGT